MGYFGLLWPKNGPPIGQLTNFRKIEGIQSYPCIWGRYDPFASSRVCLSPKKWVKRKKVDVPEVCCETLSTQTSCLLMTTTTFLDDIFKKYRY